MGMQVNTGGAGELSEPNVVPFIDVLLVLIIIFMVITPLTPKGLDTLVPQPAPPGQEQSAADQRTVVISIDQYDQLQINMDQVTWDQLGVRLEEIFKTRAERVVFVRGDPGLEFQSVAKAIDIAKGAGIDKVGLMTKNVEAGQ
jgi:biopolymer transport protein ExbD